MNEQLHPASHSLVIHKQEVYDSRTLLERGHCQRDQPSWFRGALHWGERCTRQNVSLSTVTCSSTETSFSAPTPHFPGFLDRPTPPAASRLDCQCFFSRSDQPLIHHLPSSAPVFQAYPEERLYLILKEKKKKEAEEEKEEKQILHKREYSNA